MHEIPAAWYDDPENPTQYRYWDGSAWTEHRSPKSISAPPAGRQGIIGDTWDLGRKAIGPLLGITATYVGVMLVLGAMVAVGVAQSLDPGLGDILERVTASDWNPGTDPADQAFLDSIRLDPSPTFWVATAVAIMLAIPASVLAYSMSMIVLANRHAGGSMRFGDVWRLSLRRLSRTLGISLLWLLTAALALAVLVGIWIAAITFPILLIVVIPATVGMIVYGYPYWWIATAPLFLGPPDQPPWRTLMRKIKPNWAAAAGPVLMINLVLFAINVGGGVLGLIPVVGLVVALASSVAQWVGQYASAVIIWSDLDGGVDPEITVPG